MHHNHNTIVWSTFTPTTEYWQPRCQCGWQGETYRYPVKARERAERHERAAAAAARVIARHGYSAGR